jgi:hypothetical protein
VGALLLLQIGDAIGRGSGDDIEWNTLAIKHDPAAVALEFIRRGTQLYPELDGREPKGKMNKINPTISKGIVVDITFSSRRVACRINSNCSELLQPMLRDRDALEKAVGKLEHPCDQIKPTIKGHLGVTVIPGSIAQQSCWSFDQLVNAQLELYGRCRKFILNRD